MLLLRIPAIPLLTETRPQPTVKENGDKTQLLFHVPPCSSVLFFSCQSLKKKISVQKQKTK